MVVWLGWWAQSVILNSSLANYGPILLGLGLLSISNWHLVHWTFVLIIERTNVAHVRRINYESNPLYLSALHIPWACHDGREPDTLAADKTPRRCTKKEFWAHHHVQSLCSADRSSQDDCTSVFYCRHSKPRFRLSLNVIRIIVVVLPEISYF